MKSILRQFTLSGFTVLCISVSVAKDTGDGVLINAMRDELARSMQSLKIEQMGNPYFLAYRVDEIKGFQVTASFGAISSRSETNSRTLSVELRIGDHDFDNTNFLGRSNTANFRSRIPLPLEDDYTEIRRQLWLTTDKAYKRAQELMARKQAALNNQSREEVPDFNTSEPFTTLGKSIVSKLTLDTAESLVRELSLQFKDMPEINDSRVEAGMNNRRSVYINSEGTTFTYSLPVGWVQTLARTQASDGTVLQDFDVIYQRWSELPDLKLLKRRVDTMGNALSARREAEFVDRYNGPVLFEGQAAAELFVQVMVPRLLAIRVPFTEDPRMNRVTEAVRNPFVDKIGSRVLPRFLNVRNDPTLLAGNGGSLLGSYLVDDDGIPVTPAVLIENGILKTLLATRNPVAGITAHTGNRRGILPLPGNLLITGDGGLTTLELRNEFMQLIAERGNEYGIVVRRIGNWLHKINYPTDTFRQSGGGGQTPVEHLLRAYKVYPDGREVPIRIAELSGISASTFKDIVAISRKSTNHSMMYPQASGSILLYSSALYGVPRTDVLISIVTPDLLFEDMTVRKPSGNTPNPPVVAHPFFDSK